MIEVDAEPCAGTQFDPRVVEVLVDIVGEPVPALIGAAAARV
jgi:HD-GYP domain-containing protein (c-di-GMP phosphodiesterase class II)